jgi:hypothetical protein
MSNADKHDAAPVTVAPIVGRYLVRGYCFVPAECKMIVEASSAEEAIKKAKVSDWKKSIVSNSHDNHCAFDWQPIAEQLSTPNNRIDHQ